MNQETKVQQLREKIAAQTGEYPSIEEAEAILVSKKRHPDKDARWGKTPLGYLPESWQVVRGDGVVIIEDTSHDDAVDQALWLNSYARRGITYEVAQANAR